MIEVFINRVIINCLKEEAKYFKSNILYNLFKSVPNLESISFTKSNEYDDNNYYDSFQVNDINGVSIEDECYIKDENGNVFSDWQEDEIVEKDKLVDEDLIPTIMEITDEYAQASGYDYGDHTIYKESFSKHEGVPNKAFIEYYNSRLTGKPVADESVFKGKPEIALCYAYDVLKGRLSPKIESCLKEDFYLCYLYAVNVIKGKLPRELENHFSLKSFKSLNNREKKYFKLYKEFLENSNVTQKV